MVKNVMVQVCILMMIMLTFVTASQQGNITTIAGNGVRGYNGDNILATDANFYFPNGITVNSLGEVIVADTFNYRVRKILLNGTIVTIAGTGIAGFNGDGILATSADLEPSDVTVNALGEVLIADGFNFTCRIRKIHSNGIITTIAGNGFPGFNGDGILATAANLNGPCNVAVNSLGELFITEFLEHRVRKVQLNGMITTIAGTGIAGFNGDGILATSAQIRNPLGVRVNSLGEVIFSDALNSRVRKILLNGTITTIAGTGVSGYNGDGILATSANITNPTGLTLNSVGEVLFSDISNHRIRKILLNGTIVTIAGTGIAGFNGDGILPTSAQINSPYSVTVNSLGEVIFPDRLNNRIRKFKDSSYGCPPNFIISAVGTCVCQSGYVGKQCSLYYINRESVSVSFNATQGYISESRATARIVINNAQFSSFYKTRSVTARWTFTLDSTSPTSPTVVNMVFPVVGSSSLEVAVPPFSAVGKVSVSVQLSDTESGTIISDNVPSTNTLRIDNRSVVASSASHPSYWIALLIGLVIPSIF